MGSSTPKAASFLPGLSFAGQEEINILHVWWKRIDLSVPLSKYDHVEKSAVPQPYIGQQPAEGISVLNIQF